MSVSRNKRSGNSMNKARAMMGMTMGCIYIIVAAALIYLHLEERIRLGDDVLTYTITTLMAAYGIFRIYRGWKMYQE